MTTDQWTSYIRFIDRQVNFCQMVADIVKSGGPEDVIRTKQGKTGLVVLKMFRQCCGCFSMDRCLSKHD